MTREELIEFLKKIKVNSKINKILAESALLLYLNDPEINELYNRIMS